jgi:hypothetical protein
MYPEFNNFMKSSTIYRKFRKKLKFHLLYLIESLYLYIFNGFHFKLI